MKQRLYIRELPAHRVQAGMQCAEDSFWGKIVKGVRPYGAHTCVEFKTGSALGGLSCKMKFFVEDDELLLDRVSASEDLLAVGLPSEFNREMRENCRAEVRI
jgi:hypothetical protein